MDYTLEDIARMIDHSLLIPTLSVEELENGIAVAKSYQVATVCILPYYLERCAELLQGSPVRPSTTIGFPHGGHTTAIKVAEALRALDDGGEELDVVINIGKARSGDWDYVKNDLAEVIAVTHGRGQKVKVIFENCYLSEAQKIRLCEICSDLKADWVKTSTGYGPTGATVEDVKLMRKHSAAWVQVKAAGGIRDLDMALAVRAAGATRFGCTRTADVLEECKKRLAHEKP